MAGCCVQSFWRSKPFIFMLVCVILFCGSQTFTMNNSFLPLYDNHHNVTTTWTGAIIGSISISQIVANGCTGYLLTRFSDRVLLFASTFALGAVIALSSLLDFISTTVLYYECLSLLMKLLQGFAAGVTGVTCFAALVALYPDNEGAATAVGQATMSASMACAPFITSVLYSAGGFKLAMIGVGGAIMLLSVSALFIPQLTSTDHDLMDLKSKFKLLFNPWTLFAAWHCAMCTCLLSYHSPIFSTYVEKTFGVSVLWSGLALSIPGAIFCVIAFPIGALIDRYNPYPFFLTSALLTPVTYLFMGPSPFLTFVMPSKIQILSVLAALGILIPMGAISSLPVMLDMYKVTKSLEEIPGRDLNLLIAIYCSSNPLGCLFGSFVSGIVAEKYSFAESTGGAALVFFAQTVACCVYCGFAYFNKRRNG